MRRTIAAVVAAGLLVAGSYGLRAIVNDEVIPQPSTLELTPIPRLPEVDRLISVFGERVAENGDPLDLAELGRLHLERAGMTGDIGAFGEAIESLTRAVDLAPEDRTATLRLAQASLAVHRFQDALEIANDLVATEPGDAAARLVIADAEFELGDEESAAEALNDVASLTGEIPEILTRRAQHADSMGEVPMALGYAEEALRLVDDDTAEPRLLAFHLTFVAHFLNDLGRFEEAEDLLRRAIDVDPSWSSSHVTMGWVLMSSGRLQEAFSAYETASSLRTDPSTLAMLGDISLALGEQQRAETFFSQVEPAATRTEVHRSAYRRTLAQFLADHDLDPKRAVELARQDVKERADPFGLDTYAWALYRAGEFEEARTEIEKVFAVGLSEPQILYHSALIALAEGDEGRARKELTQALDKAPLFHPLQAPDARRVLRSLED